MRELLESAKGTWLKPAEFQEEFDANFWQIDGLGFWKVERRQFFQEPGNDSWEAFAKGDWAGALRLLEASRADVESYFRRIDGRGFSVQRVRVVEEPLTGYIQWELHALRMREQCGAGIRVVSPQQVEPFENTGQLPEIFTLGTTVMYEAVYDERAILESVRRHTDRELLLRCQEFIANLYALGEPLKDYFNRRVADLAGPEGRT